MLPIAAKEPKEGLPARIAKHLGMENGLAFARGSAALYALLANLAEKDGPGEVVIPALCCKSVALAAIYAGHEPRFAEVSSESLCVTPKTIAPLLSERTRAVLVVHLYGIDAAIGNFTALRRAYPSVAFVEDIAHALGGYDRHGRLLGGGMDYTLLSFADSKIVSGDGGMLLFSGKVPAESVNKINTLIPVTAPYMPSPGLALSLRNLVHGLADLRREHPAANVAPAFCAVAKNYRDLIVCSGGIGDAASVATGFSGLDAVRISRYRNYVRYREGISIGHAKVVPLHKGSTCWRCPVLFDEADRARHITKALRSAGIHASNHYFPLNLLIGGAPRPISEDVSSRIVNLWADERTPSSIVEGAINIINNC